MAAGIAVVGAALPAAASAATENASAAAPRGAYVPGEVVVGLRGGGSKVVELTNGVSVPEAIQRLERRSGVRYAQPNWIATASLIPLDRGSSGAPAGWMADQWNLLDKPGGIRVPDAWDNLVAAGAPGGTDVIVAVVDTGVALTDSPTSSTSLAPDFLPTKYVRGIDVVDDDTVPADRNGHGTHVAGTIAEEVTLDASSTEADYETGIAYGARLMPVRVLDATGAGSATNVAEGISWAANNGADVINVSLQFDPAVISCVQVPTVCEAIREANRLGALVVAAAGNALTGKGTSRALFPAAAPGAVAVAATTEHGCLAEYSHFNRRVDLLAPGGGTARPAASRGACAADSRQILQLTYSCFPTCTGDVPGFAIRPDTGTSMAAAHTSAVAALVRASGVAGVDPSPKRLFKRLSCTARKGGKPRRFYHQGMLDAARATSPTVRCRR